MMTEEQLVTTRLSRRQFMGATAAATFAAFVEGREPRLHARVRTQGDRRCGDRPVDGRGNGAYGDVRSQDVHAVRAWRAGGAGPQHLSDHRHRGRQHQVHSGSRADREGHRSRRGDPHVQRCGPGVHPSLTAPVSLAHGLHPAPADGDASPRSGRLEDARAEGSDHARLHRDWPEHGNRRRERRDQGLSHGGISGRRARPLPDRESARRGGQRPAGQGARRATIHHATAIVREARGQRAGGAVCQRFSARVVAAVARVRRPAAPIAVRQGVRPVAGTQADVRRIQYGAVRSGLPAGPAPDRRRRTVCRGHDGIHSVSLLGHARERPRTRGDHEAADRRADRAADSRPRRAGPARDARSSCSRASSGAMPSPRARWAKRSATRRSTCRM